MNEPTVKTYTDFTLPASVVSKVDLAHLVQEVEWVDNELTAAAVRTKTSAAQQAPPLVSGTLEAFLHQNQVSLTNSRQRSELIKQLRLLKDKAPVIHMTFAVSADPESLQQLAVWVRSSVHPQAVIAVGLQPALVAGVYLRTPNHVLDLSLRAMLKNGHGLLVKELEALRAAS